jgi:hypothetical protein
VWRQAVSAGQSRGGSRACGDSPHVVRAPGPPMRAVLRAFVGGGCFGLPSPHVGLAARRRGTGMAPIGLRTPVWERR